MSLSQSEGEPQGSEAFHGFQGHMNQRGSWPSDMLLRELSAWLGLARAAAHSARVQAGLLVLQQDLQQMIEQPVASPAWDLSSFVAERLRWLEQTQETMEQERHARGFPEFPGDTVSGAMLDLLSIVARRMGQDLQQERAQAHAAVHEYLERLPALLFTLARCEEDQADPGR